MSYFNVYMRTIDNESAELDLFTTDKETAEKSARAYASKEGKKVVICNVKELFFLEPSLIKEKPVTRAKDIIDYSDLSSIRDKETRDRERLERQRLYFSPIVEREDGEPALPEAHSIGLGGLLSKVLNNGKDYLFQNGSLANSSPSYLLLLENWRRTGKFYESDSIPAIICKDFSEKETELSGSDTFYCELLFLYLTDYKLFQRDGLFSYEQKRDILRVILDNNILTLIEKNLTLDLLTLVYENREPTNREREKWENLTGKYDKIYKILNVGDFLRIYRVLKDIQVELPESSEAFLKELEKIVPTQDYITKTSSGVESYDDVYHPETLSIITLKELDTALTLREESYKEANLVPLPEDILWNSINKIWEKGGLEINESYVADEIQNYKRREVVDLESIDCNFLTGLYTIYLSDFQVKNYGKSLNELEGEWVNTYYLPDYFQAVFGYAPKDKNSFQMLLKKITSYSGLAGVFKKDNRISKVFPLVNLELFDEDTKTIKLSFPYFYNLIDTIYNKSIIKYKKGKDKGTPKLKDDNSPWTRATHSELVKTSLLKRRNKRAVANVLLLDQQVEEAGSPKKGEERVVSISARTLIKRNPELEQALEEAKDTRRKNTLLRRAFSDTYLYLKEDTLLFDRYEDFQLKEAPIPTIKTLDSDILRIVHKGKKLHKG